MKLEELDTLNPEQKAAATTIEGPVLVIAGAGSGKTRVVTLRIVHLIESGISPAAILAVTFTNKAAEEMRERVAKLTQHRVLICTFHSLGARILREVIHALGYRHDFTIYDEEDVEKLLKACLVELNLKDKKMDFRPFRHLISQAKNALQSPENMNEADLTTDVERALPQVYRLYQRKLQDYNAVDFDDLLYLPVKLWREHPTILSHYQERWPFVLIDEYQDTNAAQYEMSRLLVAKTHNLFVVGDPDQSIYSWRGADVSNILNFERDYPGAQVVRLEQNYRSRTNILNAANKLIEYNDNRYAKNLWSQRGTGDKIQLFIGDDDRAEADFVASRIRFHQKQGVPLHDMVLFYRTNAQSRALEDMLLSYEIPYLIVGGVSFYQRREIKDILAFLRMIHSGADFISFSRTINLPKRGLGEATIEKMRLAASEAHLTIWAYCEAVMKGVISCKMTSKQKEGLKDYVDVLYSLRQKSHHLSLKDLVLETIKETRYLEFLKEDSESYEDRKANLDELVTKAVEWEMANETSSLTAFLEELSLKSSLDEMHPANERVNLMTVHNGKGLEFTVAFLVGLEEDLFPHINSKNRPEEIEEERRLCYVGMTRAKDYLYLSYCHSRYLWGNLRFQRPSRFLKEIPLEYLEKCQKTQRTTKPFVSKPVPSFHRPSREAVIHNFNIGDTIFHQEFGIGQVKESFEGSLGLTYKIFFLKDGSLKTIVAKYASITKL